MRWVGRLLGRALARSVLVVGLVVVSAATAGVVVAAPGQGQAPRPSFEATPNPAQTGETVTFNAAGSTDPGGSIVRYEWDLDGNGSFETDSGTDPTVSRAYSNNGTVNVKLRVTDDDGNTGEAVKDVTITNRRPTASFSATPNPASTGQPVTFDAGASQDPDGSIAKHEWDLDGNGTFETDSGTAPTVSRTYSTAGTVNVKLQVTDDDGATSQAAKDITITNTNRAPSASFTAAPNPALTGQAVSFDARASQDPDGSIAKYEWDLDGNGTFETDSGTDPTASRAYSTAGTVNVKLRVTDNAGGTDERTLAVRIDNRPPVAVNARPRAAFTYYPRGPVAGQEIALTSISSDPDGPIAGHAWDLDNDGQFDDGSGVAVSHVFWNPGTYTVRLRVRDTKGATATTSAAITILAAAQPPPQLVSPFPVVRILGRLGRGGVRIRRLSVRAPAETTITVRCRGRGCPYRRASAPARPGRSVRFRRLERRLRAGTLVEILVSHPTKIGKYTGFRIRRGRSPRRKDLCLAPGARRGSECPSG